MIIRDLLIRHEGLKLKPYKDTVGLLTIGCGRNLDDVGISQQEALYLLDNDIHQSEYDCAIYPWYAKLSDARKAAVLSLSFNLGPAGLAKFKRFLLAMSLAQWKVAGYELENSLWFSQVGTRGPEIKALIETETWPA